MKINYKDLILLVLLVFFICSSLLGTIFSNDVFIFSINDLLGLCLLFFSIRLIFLKSDFGQVVMLILIGIVITNGIKISYSINDVTYSSTATAKFGSLSFNPNAFLLFIFYVLINRRNAIIFVRKLFNGSEEEQLDKQNRMINFYYKQFNSCDGDELTKAFNNYNDYPSEAKLALKRIRQERNLLT